MIPAVGVPAMISAWNARILPSMALALPIAVILPSNYKL